jgi:hypothetical protein
MRFVFKGLRALAIAAAAVAAIPAAHAQATRTWVSGVGDDVNPCSRTAPCKTWAGAISKTATGGEINALDPGGYGALTITKAITIDGAGTHASTLSAGTNGFIVNVPAGTVVVIRNVSIQGAGSGLNGVHVVQGGEVHLENVTITGVTGQGVNFVPTVTSAASYLHMKNVSIRSAAGGAVLVKPGAGAYAFAMLSQLAMDGNARGVRAEDGATVAVRDSHASGNDANGFVALAASRPVFMSIENSTSAGNGAAGVYSGAFATVRLANTTVVGNLDGLVLADGGVILSAGNNRVLGNINSNAMPTSVVGQQ